MPQFEAIDPAVEVHVKAIVSIVNAVDIGQETRLKILKKHGIDPFIGEWYPQQKYLDAFKEISENIGDRTLFMIGKSIPEYAEFPPHIDNLEKALASIDVAYNMNHRGGRIGRYQLVEFLEEDRTAVIVCDNPYPSEFDRGIITTMLRRFRPEDSIKSEVIRDLSKESRVDGHESCTYNITW